MLATLRPTESASGRDGGRVPLLVAGLPSLRPSRHRPQYRRARTAQTNGCRRHLHSRALTVSGTEDYIYGPTNQPVEQISLSTSAPTYLTYTAADDSWLATNQAGDQTGYWRDDAYGTPISGGIFTAPASSFGYSGQYSDADTGLVNDRARWYQPQDGGFTTRDSLFDQTDTAYTYANHDPVNNSDPSGRAVHFDQICGNAGCFGTDIWGIGGGWWHLGMWIFGSSFPIYGYAFFMEADGPQFGWDYHVYIGGAQGRRTIVASGRIKIDTYWNVRIVAEAWGLWWWQYSVSAGSLILTNP